MDIIWVFSPGILALSIVGFVWAYLVFLSGIVLCEDWYCTPL